MTPNRPKISWRNIVSEFLIVVIGVAVALAADGWRQDWEERRLEVDYLNRVIDDLSTGQGFLTVQADRRRQNISDLDYLIDQLSGNDKHPRTLAETFRRASGTGGSAFDYEHDTTYRELISTGRLNLIQETEIRSEITEYYRSIENVKFVRESVPESLIQRFAELTGGFAYHYGEQGPSLSEDEVLRIYDDLRDNPSVIREARDLRARIRILYERTENAISYNQRLQDSLKLSAIN